MDFKISKEWLKRRANRDKNAEVSAGISSLDNLISEANAVRQSARDQEKLISAFGKLVRYRRIELKLSIEILATRANVDDRELISIEQDRHYVPEPRAVYKLAKVLGLPEKSLLQLSGNMVANDSDFSGHAERFAACAGNVEKLSKEQYDALKDFVRYLGQIT